MIGDQRVPSRLRARIMDLILRGGSADGCLLSVNGIATTDGLHYAIGALFAELGMLIPVP